MFFVVRLLVKESSFFYKVLRLKFIELDGFLELDIGLGEWNVLVGWLMGFSFGFGGMSGVVYV